MAWYRTGTITVTNGSTAASGTLTAWLSNVRAGDFLFIGTAAPVEIASIASNTTLTLAAAWPGASQTSVAYAVAQGSAWGDVTALSVQIAQLIANQTDILSGSGVPSDSLGADGSVYFRLDAPEYYAKASGTWGTAISLTGPAGPAGPGVSATSTTSNTIGTGTKTFTVGSGASAFLGARMRAARTAAPANYIEGIVTAVTSTTITITATLTGGSGTYTDWSITLAGEPGVQGPAGSPSIGTSPSSVTIGTGTKTFTVPASLDLIAGQRVRFADAAAPATNWMEGTITAYSSTTMVINVAADGASTAGSGTISSWTFGIIGSRGLQGPQGDPGDTGAASTVPGPSFAATSTSSVAIGTGDKDFTTQAGLAYVVNASRARAADSTNPDNFVEGLVTIYSSTSMRIAVDRIGGTGTISSWNISLAGDPGQDGAAGLSLTPVGDYDSGTTYEAGEVVRDGGASWAYINSTPSAGNDPPTLPTESDTYWQLVARDGVDGSGAVNSVNGLVGAVTLTDQDIGIAGLAPTSYTPADATVEGHLSGIGDQLSVINTGAHHAQTTIASASTTDIAGAATDMVVVTGNNAIANFGNSPNRIRYVRFTGTPTLTHNPAVMSLIGAASIAVIAGSTAVFAFDATGVGRMIAYHSADGRALVSNEAPAFTPPTTVRVLLSGQSNAGGHNTGGPALTGISTKVKLWNNASAIGGGVGSAYVTPTLNSAPLNGSSYTNMLPFFGHRLALDLGADVFGTLVFQDGTAISEWTDSDGDGRPMYDRILAVWAAQGSVPYDVFLWDQGESDGVAQANTPAATYKTRMLDLVADLRTAGVLTADCPIIMMGLATNTNYTAIDDALRELARDNAGWYYSSGGGMATSDSTHWTGDALCIIGHDKLARLYFEHIGYPGTISGSKVARKVDTASQSISTAGQQKLITWNGLIRDTGGFYYAADTSRFVIPAYVYEVEAVAAVGMSSNQTDTAYGDLWFNVYNRFDVLKGQTVVTGQNTQRWGVSGTMEVLKDDYMTVGYRQYSGSTKTTATNGTNFFEIKATK